MRGRRGVNGSAGEVARTAVLASLIAALLAGSVAMVSAATTIDLGPRVGDILVFRQGARMPTDWEFTATTGTTPPQSCTLRPEVMALNGGSLVVEQRFDRPRAFQVHWAGTRTADGSSDCGGSAELVLPHADLQLLSNAVGGPGVERSVLTRF